MNSTNVPSKNQKEKNTYTVVAGSTFIATENTLEIPPEGQVFENISSYIEEQGNMEIPVGNSKVNENGTLEMQDGTTITMVNPNAYAILAEEKARKAEKEAKIARKVAKAQAEEVR